MSPAHLCLVQPPQIWLRSLTSRFASVTWCRAALEPTSWRQPHHVGTHVSSHPQPPSRVRDCPRPRRRTAHGTRPGRTGQTGRCDRLSDRGTARHRRRRNDRGGLHGHARHHPAAVQGRGPREVDQRYRRRPGPDRHRGFRPARRQCDRPGRRIWAGMSGSPIYVNGQLLGALSYGFSASPSPDRWGHAGGVHVRPARPRWGGGAEGRAGSGAEGLPLGEATPLDRRACRRRGTQGGAAAVADSAVGQRARPRTVEPAAVRRGQGRAECPGARRQQRSGPRGGGSLGPARGGRELRVDAVLR